jgi:hypothetical protein
LIERWAAKFDWRSRVAAHGTHLAIVEREAIEAVARSKAAEWGSREQRLRETEWELHERAIAAAKKGLDAFMERDKVYANLADIARMLEIASKLGRLATGLGTDGERRKGDELPAVRVEVSVALEKIYGQPLPEEVAAPPATIVDVEEIKDRTDATNGTDGKHLTPGASMRRTSSGLQPPSPQSGEGTLPSVSGEGKQP